MARLTRATAANAAMGNNFFNYRRGPLKAKLFLAIWRVNTMVGCWDSDIRRPPVMLQTRITIIEEAPLAPGVVA
jgi:hypothetical protein